MDGHTEKGREQLHCKTYVFFQCEVFHHNSKAIKKTLIVKSELSVIYSSNIVLFIFSYINI